ncbi:MAG: 23S rRNA (uracil(1939)-C(5))-methyltransferase RlmD [Hominisplanchenecus sp.]
MKKDDLIDIIIEDIGSDGAGVGKADGFTLFVKDTIPGDRAKVKIMKMKKRYGYARLMELITPSPDRVQPPCPVARQCGGCQIQAMAYEKQLAFKENKVKNNLQRIGGLDPDSFEMEPICGMEQPFGYRNKAQFPIGRDKNGKIVAGFYAGRTHSIIANTNCSLGVPQNEQILKRVISWMETCHIEPYDETNGQGLVRHVLIRFGFTTKEIMVCLVINGRKLPKSRELSASLNEIPGMTSITANINMERTNVILGKELILISGKPYIEDYIGDIKYQISPLSFFQVNPVQTRNLYGKALEYAGLTGNETVWDLYCGIGTISLFLARKAQKVYGVEIVPEAIADARNNAKINGIKNAEFYVGKAEEVLPEKYRTEGIKADVIVIDPPRKGCDEALLDTIVKMQPQRVVYVSCDSATLARDLKYMKERGYEVEKGEAVDMFPMTVHVETVVLLSQQKADDHIEVDLELDELDITSAETKATYREIQQYVMKQTGMMVSDLNIAQVRRKCGLDMRENFNLPKSKDAKQPKCPEKKEKAILEALEHFGMV